MAALVLYAVAMSLFRQPWFQRRRTALALLLALAWTTASRAADPLARPRMSEFVGINGHTVQFRPKLYRPVAGLVRDYHPVEWDLGKATPVLPPFPQAKNGVDWNQVYGSWRLEHWNIDACLMFESIPRPQWQDIAADARAYGAAFAREFGPSGKRQLVDSVEIGNEPGKWDDADYTRMFRSLAAGLRAGDPKLKIVTCNLATGSSGDYEKTVTCVAETPELYDVLNIHSYPQLAGWPTWRRSFPEDPRLARFLPDLAALCQWRDTHAPGKAVWLTEFGYDSSTKLPPPGGDAAKWVGVTDTQQAQWLVRSLLVLSALPLERAYVYFFNDEDQPGLHASSGLTRHFEPKPAFHALVHLQLVLGDFRFSRIVTNEPARLRVQEYRAEGGRVVWAVWSPTGDGQAFAITLTGLPGKLVTAHLMPSAAGSAVGHPFSSEPSGSVSLRVGESPVYLLFDPPGK